MDMLYFGDTVPYSYPQAYKQGPYCDFNSACVYPPVGPVPNAACRFSSVPASYGSYALTPGACNGFFGRKPTRIKGTFYVIGDRYRSYITCMVWFVTDEWLKLQFYFHFRFIFSFFLTSI